MRVIDPKSRDKTEKFQLLNIPHKETIPVHLGQNSDYLKFFRNKYILLEVY